MEKRYDEHNNPISLFVCTKVESSDKISDFEVSSGIISSPCIALYDSISQDELNKTFSTHSLNNCYSSAPHSIITLKDKAKKRKIRAGEDIITCGQKIFAHRE
jgi:hypothetical protein